MLEFNTLSIEPQTCVHLLHLIQIDDSFALSTTCVGEVFEEELTGEFTLFQREPTAAPSLTKTKKTLAKISVADRIENFTANQ